MSNENEFRFAGMNMSTATLGYGIFLVVWGAIFSIGSTSMTSWIPSMVGAPILIAGILTRAVPSKHKVWMHIAVVFGLLCFLGGFRFFAAMGSEGGLFGNVKAATSQLMLMVTGGVYTFACVRSFIWARKAREAAAE